MERAWLEERVAAGRSIRAIAAEADVSYSTARYWLNKYGIRTPRAERLDASLPARRLRLPEVDIECRRHGVTRHVLRERGGYRCLRCRNEDVVAWRRRVKLILVREAGGSCVLCGYDRSAAALQFHHVDPATKAFHLSDKGVARSLARARAEAAKCVLLCGNCHAEVEAGVATLAPSPRPDPG